MILNQEVFIIFFVYEAMFPTRTLPQLSNMESETSYFSGITVPLYAVVGFHPLRRIQSPGMVTHPADPRMPLAPVGLLLL